jgi:protein-disulfide isomerase
MAQSGNKNLFAVWVSVAVVVVLVGIGALVWWMNASATAPGEAPQASNINAETGAISFGDGPDKVAVYVDFICPYCGQFEAAEGEDIAKLVDDGSITLDVHPLGILDRASQGTEFSSRAAGAMYAISAADPDNALAFMTAMFANQPEEGSTGLTDEQIIEIAKVAGVNVTPELEDAITSNRYQKFAQGQDLPEGATGTPTLMINDELVPVTYDFQADIASRIGQ